MNPAPAIRTFGLTKRYGTLVAVDDLDLEVRPGEVFGLLGPNGAGKTTTILMLLGLTEPSAGRAEVLGFDPRRQPLEVKRRVGYLPDAVGFYPAMTGRDNLVYTARLNRIDEDTARRRAAQLLDMVGLTHAADDPTRTYSRGMLQRLGLADALIKDPSVLILDEPTIAIDPEGVAEILELIRSLARDRGVALLLSSHLLHQVESVCDRVGIFVGGRLVAQGPPAELAAQLGGGHSTWELGVEGPTDDVVRELRRIPAVRALRVEPGRPGMWEVIADADSGPALAAAVIRAGGALTHMRRRGTELDVIYRRYFEAYEAGDGHRR